MKIAIAFFRMRFSSLVHFFSMHPNDKYQELKDMYRYKGRVPEATKQDFEKYRAVKATGVIGTVRVPPYPIDSSKLELKDAHALSHGCTIEDARRYVDNAKCSIRRKKWDGFHTNYYSFEGAAYIEDATAKVNTIYPSEKFNLDTKIFWRSSNEHGFLPGKECANQWYRLLFDV